MINLNMILPYSKGSTCICGIDFLKIKAIINRLFSALKTKMGRSVFSITKQVVVNHECEEC